MGAIVGLAGGYEKIGNWLGGTGEDPGALGLGRQKFDPHQINQESFQDPYADQRRQELANRLSQVDNRQAPSMDSVRIGNMQNGTAANIDQTTTAGRTTLGQAATYGGANAGQATTGNASEMNAANINRGEDAQWRAGQRSLSQDLQNAAAGKGPSTAQMQLQKSLEAQQQASASAAASRGGNQALARRALENQRSSAAQAAARDSAELKVQEQIQARNELQNLQQGARSQDLNVAAQQAGMYQDASKTNAGFGQQMTLSNMDAINQRAALQAQMYQQAGLSNQAAFNDFMKTQAGMDQQANMFNAQNINQRAMSQASLQQQMLLANMNANNSRTMQQSQFDFGANQANLQSQLNTMSLNDAMARYYSDAGLGLDARQQQAQMSYEQLMANQQMGYDQLSQASYEGARQARAGLFGGMMGAGSGAMTMAAVSDFFNKSEVKDGAGALSSFLNMMPNNHMGQGPANSALGQGLGIYNAASALSDENEKKDKQQIKTIDVNKNNLSWGNFSPIGDNGMAPYTDMSLSQPGMVAASGGGYEGAGSITQNSLNPETLKDQAAQMGMLGKMMDKRPTGNAFTDNFNSSYSGIMNAGSYAKQNQAMAAQTPKAPPVSQSDERNKSKLGGTAKETQNFLMGVGSKQDGSSNAFAGKAKASQTPAQSQMVNALSNREKMNRPEPSYFAGGINYGAMGNRGAATSGSYGGSGGYDDQSGTGNAGALNTHYADFARQGTSMDNSSRLRDLASRAMGAPRAESQSALTPNAAAHYQLPQTSPFQGFNPPTFSFSDENQKTDKEKEAENFLGKIQAYKYKYKNPEMPGAGYGEYVSPMAQDIEKAGPIGKSMVIDTPDGKVVDYGKGFGTMLASESVLHKNQNSLAQRVMKLEREKKNKKGRKS